MLTYVTIYFNSCMYLCTDYKIVLIFYEFVIAGSWVAQRWKPPNKSLDQRSRSCKWLRVIATRDYPYVAWFLLWFFDSYSSISIFSIIVILVTSGAHYSIWSVRNSMMSWAQVLPASWPVSMPISNNLYSEVSKLLFFCWHVWLLFFPWLEPRST